MRLGCKPWFGGIPYCVQKKKGVWKSDLTISQNVCYLRMIGDEMQALRKAGFIGTTDPRHMKEHDVLEYAYSIRKDGPAYQYKKLCLVNIYLNVFRNHAMDDLLAAGDLHMPKCPPRPVRSLEMDEIRDVFSAAEEKMGWPGSISRGLVALYFGTGVRPQELRLSEYKHLDLKHERIWIEHPKGLGNWASPGWVDIIRGDVMPLLRRYLDEREIKFRARKIDPVPLFPKLNGEFYCRYRFCQLANEVSELADVDFTWKDMRSSLTSVTVAGDQSREPAMSVQNRHSLATMRKYYENIQAGRAVAPLKQVWREDPIQQTAEIIAAKTPSIPSKFEVTGYG